MLRITEIVKDRVVLEQQTPEGPEKIIVRLVNGKQSIERITKRPPKPLGGRVRVETMQQGK